MNKIETSIEHLKIKIKYAKERILVAETESKCLEDILQRLEIIQMSKSIPHVETAQEKFQFVNIETNGTTH